MDGRNIKGEIMNEEEQQMELEMFGEEIYMKIVNFIDNHPDIDPSEVWEKVETVCVNGNR